MLTYNDTNVILRIEQRKPGKPVENDSGNDVSPGVSRGIIISNENFCFLYGKAFIKTSKNIEGRWMIDKSRNLLDHT